MSSANNALEMLENIMEPRKGLTSVSHGAKSIIPSLFTKDPVLHAFAIGVAFVFALCV